MMVVICTEDLELSIRVQLFSRPQQQVAPNTNSEPLTFRIENHKFVKLGMDSDWWEFPALCVGVLLLLGGLVAAAIIVVKKRKRLREEV